MKLLSNLLVVGRLRFNCRGHGDHSTPVRRRRTSSSISYPCIFNCARRGLGARGRGLTLRRYRSLKLGREL